MAPKTISEHLKKEIERLQIESLSEETVKELTSWGKIVRGDIIKMTTLAGSGHPGGSMSSADMYLVAYCAARNNPTNIIKKNKKM